MENVAEGPVDVVLLSGTVGAGKTTTAHALSDLLLSTRLRTAGVRHAVVDLDEIRLLRPPPEGDRFAHEVELANLAAMARNFRAAAAARLVLAGGRGDAADVARYREAVDGGRLLLCRLLVGSEAAAVRLERRHADEPDLRAWHLHRTGELAAILDAAPFEDVRVDTTDRTPAEVAHEVARLAGWAGWAG